MSDTQAENLLGLLEELFESEWFLRRISFINTLINDPPGKPGLDLKLVRLTGKRPIGAGAGMTSDKMRKWRVRLGIAPHMRDGDPAPMTFAHFLKLEQKLLREIGLDERVTDLALTLASRNETALRQLLQFTYGELQNPTLKPRLLRLDDYKVLAAQLSDKHVRDLPKDKVVGLLMLISNMSVMFTTRDWGVAGTFSSMCGSLAMASSDR